MLALRALVEDNPSSHLAIAKAGDPAALVELLKSGTPDGKDYATWSLSLSISADNQMTVAEAGGVQPLIDQLSEAAGYVDDLESEDGLLRAVAPRFGVVPLVSRVPPRHAPRGGVVGCGYNTCCFGTCCCCCCVVRAELAFWSMGAGNSVGSLEGRGVE